MTFAGINYLAVVVAGAFALVASTTWYTFLNRIVTPFSAPREQTTKTSKPPGDFLANICAVVGYLMMSFTLAGLLGHLGPDQVTVGNGVVSGAFVWFGFVLTTMTINYSFSGRDWQRLALHAGKLADCADRYGRNDRGIWRLVCGYGHFGPASQRVSGARSLSLVGSQSAVA